MALLSQCKRYFVQAFRRRSFSCEVFLRLHKGLTAEHPGKD